jgi:integrase
MPRHLLTAKQIVAAADCDLADGDGLILRVTGPNAAAVLRFTSPVTGGRREMGLGSIRRDSLAAVGESLAAARNAAEDARRLLQQKRDPIGERDRERSDATTELKGENSASRGSLVTLRRYTRDYHRRHVEPVRAFKHGQQWINSIEQHVPATLLDSALNRISAVELLDALVPILRKVPETGSRIYQRLAAVFDAAVIDGLRRENPATPIRRELRKRAGRRERTHFASMPYQDVPAFIKRLGKAAGNAARCLEFTILTAARTSEALTAEWREFDRERRTWTIPPAKMKCREQHVVYLTDRALEILVGQAGQNETFVFPSTAGRAAPMSNMALPMMLRRLAVKAATVHGFRSTFSTWANELGIAKPDAIEAALAHREENAVRRAYNRSQFLAERRALMIAWDDFLAGRSVRKADETAVKDAAVLQFPAQHIRKGRSSRRGQGPGQSGSNGSAQSADAS